ncbi:MAG: hypothetical protein ACOCQX_03610 [Candidatus Nanoarchaeia archaeon]
MLYEKLKKHISLITVILLILIFSAINYFLGAEGFVNLIGEENSYLLAFLVATFGGASFLTASSYYLIIITLALGGTNFILLGVAGGLGNSIGDTLFYLLGLKGRKTLGRVKKITDRIFNWLNTKPPWMIPVFVFLYANLVPLPNDILAVSLGVCKYPFKKLIIPLVLGNISFTMLVVLFVQHFF